MTTTATPYVFDEDLRDRIATHLEAHPRVAITDPEMRHAAVSIVVTTHDETGDAAFWLTRRAAKLRRHSGQFALPGGRIDPGETALEAALRELREEMGVALGNGHVLGVLDDFATRSGFCITPFVLWAGEDVELAPDPSEVARVHHIPLHELDSPDIPKLQPSDTPGRHIMSAPLATMGHEIYAPTAAMLFQFREVALHGRATRVAHFDQPEFARK
ncbi:MAG: CoA pyrophosphatase [Hyphomicrobiaceae bacterium]|nr:CoA pyrophosphatase [Hyphomicrobiaceae bacterium]